MKTVKVLLVMALSLWLSACVTVTESRLTQKKSPERAVENYTRLGLEYLNNQHSEMARHRLQRALTINEKYAPANDAMAQVWQYEQEYDLAEEYFKKAIKYDGKFTQARHNLGLLYFEQKNYKAAEKYLRQTLKDRYYDSRAQAYSDLALVRYRVGDEQQAIAHYQQALRLAPNNAQALLNVSTLTFEAQEYALAGRYFQRFMRLVNQQQVQHTAHSLWLGIQMANVQQNSAAAAQYAAELKLKFSHTEEYKAYLASLSTLKNR